ncbi:5400_t:CDS:2, partial [Funneliformis mosseae]
STIFRTHQTTQDVNSRGTSTSQSTALQYPELDITTSSVYYKI